MHEESEDQMAPRRLPPGVKKLPPSRKYPKGAYRWRYRTPEGRGTSETREHWEGPDGLKVAMIEINAAKQRGEWIDHRGNDTVSQYGRLWIDNGPEDENTQVTMGSRLRVIERAGLGKRRLLDVRTSDVEAWVRSMQARGLRRNTINSYLSALSGIFKLALRDRKVRYNPVTEITNRPKKGREPEKVVLTMAQVLMLADAMGTIRPEMRAMITTQFGLGLRVSEMMILNIADVDFERRTVQIDKQRGRTNRQMVKLPKTDAGTRTVPMSDWVAAELRRHIGSAPLGDDGSLFVNKHGRPQGRERYRQYFMAAVTACATLDPDGFPAETTSHLLRHSFISHMAAQGRNLANLSAIVGHHDTTQIRTCYEHPVATGDDELRNRMNDLFPSLRVVGDV